MNLSKFWIWPAASNSNHVTIPATSNTARPAR